MVSNAKKVKLEAYNGSIDKNAEVYAIIDVETCFERNVISVGVIITDDISFMPRDFKYYRIPEQENAPAMFADSLELGDFISNPNEYEMKVKYIEAIEGIKDFLSGYSVENLFAYNAGFDKGRLPELRAYRWHDIIEKAAYKQFNNKIPADSVFYGTGRLVRGYTVEDMYRLLVKPRYRETHNALMDTLDELEIMKALGYRVGEYGVIK